MRILFAAGYGDVIQTFQHWKQGEDDPSQVAITYSSQFYQLCESLNAESYIIATRSDKKRIREQNFILENRSGIGLGQPGIFYHLGQFLYWSGLIVSALRFRADFIIVPGSPYLF